MTPHWLNMSGISKIMQSGILIYISIRLYKAAGKIILSNYPFTYKMVYWFKNKTKMLKPSVAANRPPTHITLSVHWSEQKSSTLLLKFETISQQPSKPPHIYAVKPLKPQVDIVHNLGAWKSSNHRSEEHTSELQSPVPISYAVFCLKKKKQKNTIW